MKEAVRTICVPGINKHIGPVAPSQILEFLPKGTLERRFCWLVWSKDTTGNGYRCWSSVEKHSPFLRTLVPFLCWPLILEAFLPSLFSLFSVNLLWICLLCFKAIRNPGSEHSSKCVYLLPIILFPLDIRNSKHTWSKQTARLFPTSRPSLPTSF